MRTAIAAIALLQATPAAAPPTPWHGLRFDGAYVALKPDGASDCANADKGPLTLRFKGRKAFGEAVTAEPSSEGQILLTSAGAKRTYTVRRASARPAGNPPQVMMMFGRTETAGLGGLTRGNGSMMAEFAGDTLSFRIFNWNGDVGERDDFNAAKPKLGFCTDTKP